MAPALGGGSSGGGEIRGRRKGGPGRGGWRRRRRAARAATPPPPSSPSLSHDGYHPSSAPTTGGSPPQAGDADLVVRDDHGAAGELRAARRRQQLDGVALPVPHTSVASAPSPPGHFLTTGSRHWIPSPTEISPSDPAIDLLKWWWWRGGGGWIGARRLEEADGDVALRRGSTHRLFFNCFRCPSIYLSELIRRGTC